MKKQVLTIVTAVIVMLTLSLSVAAGPRLTSDDFEDFMGKSDIQPSDNAGYKNVGFQDFMGKSGIQPSNVQALELGTPTLGTVKDAAQLSKLGIKGTKVGDIVLLTLLDDGTLKISVIDVKQEKVILLKK